MGWAIKKRIYRNGHTKRNQQKIFSPSLCFRPLFHGTFPLLAFEILILLNFSLSSISIDTSIELWKTWGFESEPNSGLEPYLQPFSVWLEQFGSIVATALVRNVCCISSRHPFKYDFFGIWKQCFHTELNPLSFMEVSLNAFFPGNICWDLGAPTYYKHGNCQVALKCTKRNMVGEHQKLWRGKRHKKVSWTKKTSIYFFWQIIMYIRGPTTCN